MFMMGFLSKTLEAFFLKQQKVHPNKYSNLKIVVFIIQLTKEALVFIKQINQWCSWSVVY